MDNTWSVRTKVENDLSGCWQREGQHSISAPIGRQNIGIFCASEKLSLFGKESRTAGLNANRLELPCDFL